MASKHDTDSICWNCKFNCGLCSWSRKKNPECVAGSTFMAGTTILLQCPQYVQRYKFERYTEILRMLASYFNLNIATIRKSFCKYGMLYQMQTQEKLPNFFWYYDIDTKNFFDKRGKNS